MLRVLSIVAVLMIVSLAPAQTPTSQPPMRHGRIVSPEDKSVVGAKVYLIGNDEGRVYRIDAITTTDHDGRFAFRDEQMPPGSYKNILAQAEGFGLTAAAVSPAGDTDTVTTRMSAATELHVHFLSPGGEPVPNLRVNLARVQGRRVPSGVTFIPSELQHQLAQTTDHNGICVFPGLPQDQLAILEVPDERFVALSYGDRIELANKPTTEGVIVRLSPASSVSGRVVYGDTGLPVVGLRVSAQGASTGGGEMAQGGSGVTDADGRYVLKQLSAGEFNVALDIREPMSDRYTAAAHERLKVGSGDRVASVDFTLIEGVLVSGKVLVKGTGEPVPGVNIGIYGPAHPRSSAWVQVAVSGADGSYRLRVPAGSQHIYFQSLPPKGLLYPEPRERDIKVAEGTPPTVDFELPRNASPGLKGKVVDTDGKPVANADVAAMTNDGQAFMDTYSGAKTDGNGEFAFESLATGSVLRATHGNWMTIQAVTVGDDRRDPVILTLHKDAMSSVLVRATLPDGSPAAGAQIMLWEKEGRGSTGSVQKQTGPDGTAIIDSLRPDDEYALTIGGNGFTRTHVERLALQPGKQIETQAELKRAESFIGGTVVDTNGNPVPSAQISIDAETIDIAFIQSDANGKFFFAGLMEGEQVTLFTRESGKVSASLRATAGKSDLVLIHDPKPIPSRRPVP